MTARLTDPIPFQGIDRPHTFPREWQTPYLSKGLTDPIPFQGIDRPHTFPRYGQTEKRTNGHFNYIETSLLKRKQKERIDQSKLNFQN